MGIPTTISSFTVLPTSYSPSATHYIYAREHKSSKKQQQAGSSSNKPVLPEGRTLFLVNVPVDATERELTLFFKGAGRVERVVFDLDEVRELGAEESDDEDEGEGVEGAQGDEMDEDEEEEDSDDEPGTSTSRKNSKSKPTKPQKPTVKPLPSTPLRTIRQTGRTAYIIFLEASSLSRALAPSSTSSPRPWPHSPADTPSGLTHYKSLYLSLRPPLPAVREYADSALEVYDYEQAQKKIKSEYRKGEAVVDEDGFTLVTRGGAYGKTLGGGVGVARKGWAAGGAEEGKRKRKKKESKEGMYAFQKHEQNRKRLLELRAKFEEDKAKVAKYRESRRFKPY